MTDLAAKMMDLYRESVEAILEDDTMVFHVLPMADVAKTFISSKGADPDLDKTAEAACGTTLNDMDCVVVLGSDVLGAQRSEEEMVEIAVGHIEQHINVIWPAIETPAPAQPDAAEIYKCYVCRQTGSSEIFFRLDGYNGRGECQQCRERDRLEDAYLSGFLNSL